MEDLDMIYNMNEGKIMAGGYSVNSILLNDQKPALYQPQQEGGKDTNKVSDRFKNLAVPAGLLYIHDDISYKTDAINDTNDIINDALYEKLLHLAGPDASKNEVIHKKQTRSKKGKGKGKSKKMTKKISRRK